MKINYSNVNYKSDLTQKTSHLYICNNNFVRFYSKFFYSTYILI